MITMLSVLGHKAKNQGFMSDLDVQIPTAFGMLAKISHSFMFCACTNLS